MSVRYELDYADIEKLEEKLKRIPDNIESIINSYLHKEGAKTSIEQIIKLIPVSKKKKGIHAKLNKPLRANKINLGFEVLPKKKFNYLVFPDRGLGTSHGTDPEEFMRRGLARSVNDILEGLNEHIDQQLKEEFE